MQCHDFLVFHGLEREKVNQSEVLKLSRKVEIIAEVAQGFEGNETLVDLLVRGALSSGCDSIKFQLVYADELATPDYMHYELFKSLEMDTTKWSEICELVHLDEKRIYFDVFGLTSLEVARKAGADGVKISTTEFYNSRLFSASLTYFNRIFLSIGGIPVEDIEKKLSGLTVSEREKIFLMYGFQSEPTPIEQNNLRKITLFKEKFPDYKIGFMDHSDGGHEDSIHLSLVALGMGIDVIEKHITLDHELEIEDFVSGITPSSFSNFVRVIDRLETSLGQYSLELSHLEEEYRSNATKSVVALRDLRAGEEITDEMVSLKRSAAGIISGSIMNLESVIGRVLKTDVKENIQILEDMI